MYRGSAWLQPTKSRTNGNFKQQARLAHRSQSHIQYFPGLRSILAPKASRKASWSRWSLATVCSRLDRQTKTDSILTSAVQAFGKFTPGDPWADMAYQQSQSDAPHAADSAFILRLPPDVAEKVISPGMQWTSSQAQQGGWIRRTDELLSASISRSDICNINFLKKEALMDEIPAGSSKNCRKWFHRNRASRWCTTGAQSSIHRQNW